MKKHTRVCAVLCGFLLLFAALSPSVFAVGNGLLFNLEQLLGGNSLQDIIQGIFGDDANGQINIESILSNSELLKQLRSILGLGDNISDSRLIDTLRDLIGNASFNVNDLFSADFLQRLQEALLGANTSTTASANTPTSSYTPSYSATPVQDLTLPSIAIPTVPAATTTEVFQGAETYTTEPATAAPEESFVYVPVETPTVPYYDNAAVTGYYEEPTALTSVKSTGTTFKMVLGIFILVLSAGAVVAVVVILKKSNV